MAEEDYIRPIAGFPGYYASVDGQIWSGWKLKGAGKTKGCRSVITDVLHPLRGDVEKGGGHIGVRLYRDKESYKFWVHTLVLETVDSGPFYFSSLTDIPAVGVYFNQIHPAELMVPWPRALAVTMGDKASRINPSKRFEFQLIEIDGPCPPGMECRHLNGNPADNRRGNLKWGTPKENAADRDSHGRTPRGELQGSSVLTEHLVRRMRKMHEADWTYREISMFFKHNYHTVRLAVRGDHWRHVA